MRPLKWITLAGALLATLSLTTACRPAAVQTPHPKAAEARKAAPNFELKDTDGRTVALSDFRGKVVLLNFWATWCGPCKVEIPWFVEFEQRYKGDGFAVLGVAMDEEGWSVVKPFLSETKVNYRVMIGNDSVSQQYGGVDSLPTTFILDQNGGIASTHVGLVSKSDYENEIKELLQSKKAAVGTAPAAAFVGGAR